MKSRYDIIVVGAGHAGCEAANAAALLGAKVLLITMDLTKLAQMSCNPAMGGIAKGQIIREIDALGGSSGIVTDRSMIQFRMLNKSKGPAVWSPRAQCDRILYSINWRQILENNRNIDFWQDNVNELLIKGKRVIGIRTHSKAAFYAGSVILTIGTFGNGKMHIGKAQIIGGRISEPISTGITEQLKKYNISSGRLKTGTPARIDGRTIDFSRLEEQKGDEEIKRFSFLKTKLPKKQLSCYICYTNKNVHNILKKGFKDSPLFNGIISGRGPRYCPSIEDKIVTFSNKEGHQLFLEPEGWNTNEYYINGFSSSLPLNIQYGAIRKIKGLEKAKIFRPGYAIEYDYFMPTQLKPTLETKEIDSLYFAGQINGTTGYEEAAGQGIMAGINAFNKLNNAKDFILKRNEAYIGVLIDDLVTKGIDEPYRMFTSRAEHRISLRQDNADERLTTKAITLGLVSKERKNIFAEKQHIRNIITEKLKRDSFCPEEINLFLKEHGETEIKQKVKIEEVLSRPNIHLKDILRLKRNEDISKFEKEFYYYDLLDSIEIEIKYSGYIEREIEISNKIERLNHIIIDKGINYDLLQSISTEGRFKLKKYQPLTIGQASRISGVSPNDINVLLVHMGR
jgi:tRNA uridine 5-carboxymethylaminomethyl modification enzyme